MGAFPHAASYWTRTAEIQTNQADGSSQSFFIKVGRITIYQSTVLVPNLFNADMVSMSR